jgi:hypothetical protein
LTNRRQGNTGKSREKSHWNDVRPEKGRSYRNGHNGRPRHGASEKDSERGGGRLNNKTWFKLYSQLSC